MQKVPSPYIWTYQPQFGTAAGASQDYGTKFNWLHAGNSMIQHVFDLRNNRNDILQKQAALTQTARPLMNPPHWPAELITQPTSTDNIVCLREKNMFQRIPDNGMQFAGGAIKGQGMQLNDEQFHFKPNSYSNDALFQLAGGCASKNCFILDNAPRIARSGGIGSKQFIEEFVPSVILEPFAGPSYTFPYETIYHYDVISDSVDDYS